MAHGVAAGGLFLGLLVGNLLAVLSWAVITAPIATRTRLNLYWKLRKIARPSKTVDIEQSLVMVPTPPQSRHVPGRRWKIGMWKWTKRVQVL